MSCIRRGITAGKTQSGLRTQRQCCVLSEDRHIRCDLDFWNFKPRAVFDSCVNIAYRFFAMTCRPLQVLSILVRSLQVTNNTLKRLYIYVLMFQRWPDEGFSVIFLAFFLRLRLWKFRQTTRWSSLFPIVHLSPLIVAVPWIKPSEIHFEGGSWRDLPPTGERRKITWAEASEVVWGSRREGVGRGTPSPWRRDVGRGRKI